MTGQLSTHERVDLGFREDDGPDPIATSAADDLKDLLLGAGTVLRGGHHGRSVRGLPDEDDPPYDRTEHDGKAKRHKHPRQATAATQSHG
jgi:hypothetical protein